MRGRFGGRCRASKARRVFKRQSAAATKEVVEEYWVDTSQLHLQLSAVQRIGMPPVPVLIVSYRNLKHFCRARFDRLALKDGS